MRESERTVKSITNYIISKFQEFVKNDYIIHKKSVKVLKTKKYKDIKGTNNQKVPPYILPKEDDVRNFKIAKERMLKE